MRPYLEIFKREFAIHMQNSGEWVAIILFYILLISLFPIVMGPLPHNLLWLAPIIVWIAILLTMLLAQENLLRNDYEQGILIEMQLSNNSLSYLLFAKIFAHWCIYALPIIILTPLVLLSFNLSIYSIFIITLSLIIGTMALSLLGALCVALTVVLTRGGVLLAIILLPLYTPILVLGSNIGVLSIDGNNVLGHMALLLALLIALILGAPLMVATSIRASIQ